MQTTNSPPCRRPRVETDPKDDDQEASPTDPCRASILAYICHMPRHQVVSTAVASKQFDSAAMPEGWAARGGRREDAETEGRDSGQRQRQRPTLKHTANETGNIVAVPGTGGIPTTIQSKLSQHQHQHRIHRLCVPPPYRTSIGTSTGTSVRTSSAPLHAPLPVLSHLGGSPCSLVACVPATQSTQ